VNEKDFSKHFVATRLRFFVKQSTGRRTLRIGSTRILIRILQSKNWVISDRRGRKVKYLSRYESVLINLNALYGDTYKTAALPLS
jgi:predicted transcriptional regulator